MQNILDLPLQLEKLGPAMSGVFLRSDLANLFGNENSITLSKRISLMVNRAYLTRAIRGVYYTQEAKLEDIALRIFPDGYLSLATALSMQGMIGNRPSSSVSIITSRPRGRKFVIPKGIIQMHVKNKSYENGIEILNGKRIATKEKAFIDTAYFAFRGMNFPFDLYSDINIRLLDMPALNKMLALYRNKLFRKFVSNVLAEYE